MIGQFGKNKKRMGYILLAIFIIISGMYPKAEVKAKASKQEKAQTAYASIVRRSGYKNYQFAVADVDRDGVEELFLRGTLKNGKHRLVIFRYSDGKVKKIYEKDSAIQVELYGGLYEKTLSLWNRVAGAEQFRIYKMKKNGIQFEASLYTFTYPNSQKQQILKHFFNVNRITEGKYNYYKEKYELNREPLQFYKNTSANRGIYIQHSMSFSMKAKKTKIITLQDPFEGMIAWSSNNKKVATVSRQGKISGKTAGTATITAKITHYGKVQRYIIRVKILEENDVTAKLAKNKKIKQVISKFDEVVGQEIIVKGKRYGRTSSDQFKTAVGAYNTKKSYIYSDMPGGSVVYTKKDVLAKAGQIFLTAPSGLALPNYTKKGDKNAYLGVAKKGTMVVRFSKGSDYHVQASIKKILKGGKQTYRVTVKYRVIKYQQGKCIKTKNVYYSLKKIKGSAYGYKISGIVIS